MADTHIKVVPQATYVPEQSDVLNEKFVWSYEISISNHSEEIIQLLNRHWEITDLTSHVELIDGVGVVGMQPIIKPGRTFIYSSFCQLFTPQGTMEGYYEFQNLDEKHFKVMIPKFILSTPDSIAKSFHSRLH